MPARRAASLPHQPGARQETGDRCPAGRLYPLDKSELAIIIPAWNEERTIADVVSNVSQYGIAIVVNDCSTDATAEKAQLAGADLVNHKTNKGYDGALNSGFSRAAALGCRYAITFDADGQHDFRLLPTYIDRLENNHDMVLGVRPKPARIVEHLFAWYTRIRFGIRDPFCGMKGYRLTLYAERGHFDSHASVGTELALWAARRGKKFTQVDVPISQRQDVARFGRKFSANMKLLKAAYLALVRE